MPSLHAPYPVTVLGRVAVDRTDRGGPLTAAKQRTLAVLVAGGAIGVDVAAFQGDGAGPGSLDSLRVSMSRLRPHLPDGALPEAVGGRYRLQAASTDVDVWHLRAMVEGGASLDAEPGRLRHLLRATEPFAPFSDLPALRAAAYQARRDQQRLVERLVVERPDLLDGELVDDLAAHVEDDPYNERLVLLSATLLGRSGRRPEALNLLARSTRELARLGLSAGAELVALERQLLDGTLRFDGVPDALRPSVGVPATEPSASVALPSLPPLLADHLAAPFVGSDAHLARLVAALDDGDTGSVATLDGRSGAGKTRACAELARVARSRGIPVLYAAPPAAGGAALGAFLALFPALEVEVAAALARHDDLESRRAALWGGLARVLDDAAAGGPLLLVVDDCQWLDSLSADFLVHLAARRVPGRRLVLAGRADDGDDTPWPRLLAAAQRVGGRDVAVPPFDEEAVAQLVLVRRPALGELQARRVAPELLDLSGGLPGVAVPLVDALDPGTLALPTARGLRAGRALELAVGRLDDDARTVGTVASIIGPSFDLATVADVADLAVPRVVAALDDLVRRALVVERTPTTFRVAHLLVQSAFVAATARTRLAVWHERAATRCGDDVHRVARHLAEAVPLVPAVDAAAALVRSADAHLAAGLARPAAAAFREAEELAGPHPPAVAGRFARALDLSGLHELARGVRSAAFEQALAAGDVSVALAVATSGLPEAEPIDGDLALVGHLQRLTTAAPADPSDRWLLAHQLARQLAIAGRVDEAADAAAALPALAVTERQRLDAAVVRRFVVSATTPPPVRLALLDEGDVERAADADQRAGYLMVRAIDLYEAGRVDEAMAAFARITPSLDELPAWRRWHTLLFTAMAATDAGADETERRARRQDAFAFAVANGLGEAHNGLLVAEFVDRWLRDGVAALRGAVDGGLIDPERSVLLRAGASVILASSGDAAGGAAHAREVVRLVARSPVSQGVAAVALVSEVLARHGDDASVAAAARLLAARGDSMIVVGAGAACLGPVARYLAVLSPPGEERTARRRAAVDLADRSGLRLWQAVTRRDRVADGPDPAVAAELAALGEDPSLADLALDRA